CPVSNKSSKHQTALAISMQSHTDDRPFRCTDCGKRFFHRHHLLNHQSRHDGEKPFAFGHCGQHF
ncbi:ZG8 protein, partial [Columbina picui]|nr:ZG8 protein [Columbina picui]